MLVLKGIGGSKGYAGGTAVIKRETALRIPICSITDVGVEIARFTAARENYDKHLKELAVKTAQELGEESAEIFGAYRAILYDDVFFNKVLDRVSRERINIEYLIREECAAAVALLDKLGDTYMRERAADIENVCTALIRTMLGRSSDLSVETVGIDDVIIVADDLTPAETIRIDKSRLRGFITVRGGVTSHTVILAKALGIPALVGVEGALKQIAPHASLLLDAVKGEVIVDPGEELKSRFFETLSRERDRRLYYEAAAFGSCETLDGFHVDVVINSGDSESLAAFRPEACDGIGLFRTEYLYMDARKHPDGEHQYEVYREAAGRACGKEVVIRTLDVGGDKQIPYMNLPREENPFLGHRAIRLCLSRRDMFLTQLRAILRAAAHGNVKVMFPLISTLEELMEAKELLAEAARQLEAEGVPHRADLPVGIMMETPAAVFLADRLAENCDFFSIGSNDLIQYVTAADRTNPSVRHLYDICNPSVLRAIRQVAATANAAGIPWGICGESASEAPVIPLWVALGVSELSVTPPEVGRVKHIIRRLNRARFSRELDAVFEMSCTRDVRECLIEMLKELDN